MLSSSGFRGLGLRVKGLGYSSSGFSVCTGFWCMGPGYSETNKEPTL